MTTVATATIFIPTALRAFAGGNATYNVPATTVGQALGQLTAEHPDLRKHLYTDEGKLRSFVNIYVGEEDIRYLDEMDTKLTDGVIVALIPAVAGG